MPRRYDTSTYKNHERPHAWGSPCPDDIDNTEAQLLLGTGVEVDGAIWNVDGRTCFRTFSHGMDGSDTLWHGHPIPWSRLPVAAKNRLIEAGRLDERRANAFAAMLLMPRAAIEAVLPHQPRDWTTKALHNAMAVLGVGKTTLVYHLYDLRKVSASERDAWLDDL